MPVDVIMPKLGLTMTEGVLTLWLVPDGANVNKGQSIFEIETDKAVIEAQAAESGVLHITVEAGARVPVLEKVGYIITPGEAEPAIPHVGAATSPTSDPAIPASIAGVTREIQHISVSNRQTKEEGQRNIVPIQGVRAVIAQRMLASVQSTAPVTLTSEVDATKLVNLRQQLNRKPGEHITYNDILVKIIATCLREFPYMNAQREGDAIRLLTPASTAGVTEVNVGVAVDTERGLIVPVIHNADQLSIAEISRELGEKAKRALEASSLPDELTGGTFTLTNLGGLGVDAFTPVINLPEVAILGVGQIVRKPVEYQGEIALRYRMVLSLTFDHCLVDGSPAARFLRHLKELVEEPDVLL